MSVKKSLIIVCIAAFLASFGKTILMKWLGIEETLLFYVVFYLLFYIPIYFILYNIFKDNAGGERK